MQQQVVPRAIAAGAVIAAAGLVLLTRPSLDDSPRVNTDSSPQPASIDLAAAREDATPAQRPEASVAEKLRELEAMSETFRNTTFLIAIRDAGFVCNELLRVYGGGVEALGWIVTCSEMLAYTVGVAGDGALRVEPTLQYFDNLGPSPVPRDNGDAPLPAPPREILPPPRR